MSNERNCVECSDPIPAKRLAAVPNAIYCRNCQERRERHGAVNVPTGVMAIAGEADDNVRRRESGWEAMHHTATVRVEKIGGKYRIPA